MTGRQDATRIADHDTLGDGELVQLARAQDGMAFRAIMQRHNRRLYRTARAVTRDDGEAEDIVQEAYSIAFAGLDRFRGESSLATWLTRIVLNEALGRLRRRRPTVELSAIDAGHRNDAHIIQFPLMTSTSDPESAVARQEIRRLIERAIDRLPEAFRIVFMMRDVEELSVEETAALLGLPEATVKTRLHRARRLLRQALDEQLAPALEGAFPFDGARCARMTNRVLERFGFSPPPAAG